MRAVVYSHTGGPEVLRLVERPVREPGPGEVRVKIHVSGVNPTDWKARRGGRAGAELPFPELVPNQDGAGTIDAVRYERPDLVRGFASTVVNSVLRPR